MQVPTYDLSGGVTWRDMTAEELADYQAALAAPAPPPELTREAFCVALTKTTPPILTEAEALQALERWPDKFAAALVGKPLAYRAAAIEAWRTIKTVPRDAPLFLDLLAFYAGAAGLNEAQAAALGDQIFAGASNG